MQTLPQLKAHAAAALRVGVSPCSCVKPYTSCAPFIGFPKTLNAIATINEVFKEKGIALPLEAQATTAEDERYEKGHAIQYPLYGDEIARKMEGVPDSMGRDVARFLTEYAFGDIYTRGGLSVEMRELLIYCILTTIGADAQLYSHAQANVKLGYHACHSCCRRGAMSALCRVPCGLESFAGYYRCYGPAIEKRWNRGKASFLNVGQNKKGGKSFPALFICRKVSIIW